MTSVAKVSLATLLREDLATACERDPAARKKVDVALTYAGVHALWLHRISSRLWNARAFLAARVLSAWGRRVTGVEIHPAAVIGRRLFIDHGMGVVIGETAEIGDDVLLYHGVTLGGTSSRPGRRHPRIGDGVVIGAGATVLGAVTIAAGARVGAQAVVLTDVAPDVTVVGVPAQVVAVGETDALWDPAVWI